MAYKKFPTQIEANDRIYKIDSDFRIALDCFNAINDPNLNDIERFYVVMGLLIGNDINPLDEMILKEKITYYLRCGQEETKVDTIDMDYFQDENAIRTSILKDYSMDIIDIDYLHWWDFNQLIGGLSEDCELNRIRDLRQMDISTIKDEKAKSKIIKAKQRIALKKEVQTTEEENDSYDNFKKLLGGE